jgi:hypothetical protein
MRLCGISLFASVIALVLVFPLDVHAQTTFDNCELVRLNQQTVRKFIEPDYQQDLERMRKSLCEFIDGKRADGTIIENAQSQNWSKRREVADAAWRMVVAFSAYCSRRFSAWLEKNPFPATHRYVFNTFCKDYLDNLKVLQMDFQKSPGGDAKIQTGLSFEMLQKFSQPYHRFRQDYFCAHSGWVASPGGWSGLTQPDVPAVTRLQGVADSLCDESRSGSITVDEAVSRWNLELLRFERRVGPEVTRKSLGQLSDIVKSFLD